MNKSENSWNKFNQNMISLRKCETLCKSLSATWAMTWSSNKSWRATWSLSTNIYDKRHASMLGRSKEILMKHTAASRLACSPEHILSLPPSLGSMSSIRNGKVLSNQAKATWILTCTSSTSTRGWSCRRTTRTSRSSSTSGEKSMIYVSTTRSLASATMTDLDWPTSGRRAAMASTDSIKRSSTKGKTSAPSRTWYEFKTKQETFKLL